MRLSKEEFKSQKKISFKRLKGERIYKAPYKTTSVSSGRQFLTLAKRPTMKRMQKAQKE
jgi:hypothetical protein